MNQATNTTNDKSHLPRGAGQPLASTGLCLLFTLSLVAVAQTKDTVNCQVRSAFRSDGSISTQIRQALQQARSEVLVALYGFNNPILAHELVSLAKKGLQVRVKIDAEKTGRRKTRALIGLLRAAGVAVKGVAADGRNQNKFVIIDGKRVITGSYNWTTRAEENWENVLFLDCPELAKRYATEWEKIE